MGSIAVEPRAQCKLGMVAKTLYGLRRSLAGCGSEAGARSRDMMQAEHGRMARCVEYYDLFYSVASPGHLTS